MNDSPHPVLDAILELLDGAGAHYRLLTHGPTRTCEESAAARGESTDIGGKTILLKVGERFHLCTLSAARRLDSNALRRQLFERRARFATPAELLAMTGLVPGSVPPFGPPVLDLPLLLDEAFLANRRIAFNAGSLEHSVIMETATWRALAQPRIVRCSKPAPSHPPEPA